VAELARELQFVTARKHVDAPRSLADYGLEPPSARISVTPKGGGAEQTLYLGWIDDSGEDGGLFAKRADLPTVFTMDGHLVTLLPTSPTSFREKRLVTRSLKGLRSLHYHRGDTELVLEDIPDKGWTLTTPAVDDTDQVAASNFVARLREIEAHRFLGKTQSLFGLVQPDMTISLRFDDLAAPLVVKVGGPTPDPETGYYYACQDTGVVVTVPAGDVEQLQITDFDLRNRQLLAFNPREASRVYLKFEGSEYTFARNPSGVAFDVVQPQGMRFESQSDMAVLLDALKNVYAKARVADPGDAATGLAAPVLVAGVTVRVNDPDTPGAQRDETVDTLVVGNLAEGASHQRYATVASRDEVFLIDQDLISTLRESLRGVRHE